MSNSVNNNCKVIGDRAFALSRNGMSYQEIVEVLKKEGIEKTIKQIRKLCVYRYKKLGLENEIPQETWGRVSQITDEDIYIRRKNEQTFKQMREAYAKQRISITESVLSRRCAKIFKARAEEILKHIEQDDLTLEELEEMLKDIYGVYYKKIHSQYANKDSRIKEVR